MIGHLHLFWHWALDYAQDGNLSDYDPEDIADAADWEGDPQQFVDALLNCGPGDSAGFLEYDAENRLMIHDWWDYAGKLIAKRQADAERKRTIRHADSERLGYDVQKKSDGHHTDVPSTARVNQPTNQPEESAAPKRAATSPAPKPKRHDQAMWDAAVEAIGFTPQATAERGKWNSALRQLREAGVTTDEIPRLVENYRGRYGSDIDCNPAALANKLGQLRAARGRPRDEALPDVTGIAERRRLEREQLLRERVEAHGG